ncbi:MAG: DUF4399 domain-containing protein [Nitrospinales bacterium]
MRANYLILVILALILTVIDFSPAHAERAIYISQPANGSVVTNPVKICIVAQELKVEAAKTGRGENRGHHHLSLDAPLPTNWENYIPKNSHNFHLGNGADCKTLHIEPGKHVIRALFGYADHTPFYPPITDTIVITVK